MQGDRHGVTAYRVDTTTGVLVPHGQPIEIRHRPVHLTLDANATHVLVAYNNPSSLSVHALKADGTLGAEVKQPARSTAASTRTRFASIRRTRWW